MITSYIDNCRITVKMNQELDSFKNKLEKWFSPKIIGKIKNNLLNTNILGIDLSYDDRKGESRLSMSSYIEKLKDKYPILLIDNLKDELILNIDGYKKKKKQKKWFDYGKNYYETKVEQ